MCGRFVVAGASTDLVALFDVDVAAEDLPGPSWNVAPTDRVGIVLDSRPKGAEPGTEPIRRLEAARWGLIPSWAKEPRAGVTAFNARIESVTEKAHFRTAVRNRRVIVPASGYYEWHTVGETKTPYYLHPAEPWLFFAGVAEWWRDPAKPDDDPTRWVLSTSILTQSASGGLERIHDRMPVFLPADIADEWLDPDETDPVDLLAEVAELGQELATSLRAHPVSRAVGNVRNNTPDLITEVGLTD